MAKYPYIVNKDGVWYPSGTDVPEGKAVAVEVTPTITEPKAETPTVSKTDINRMSTSELRKFASKNGVDNADEFIGSELKKILIDKLGL